MSWYPILKHIHVTCAVITVSFFFLRGIWMLADSSMITRRWVKILPHVIDTLLLVSAIGLSIATTQYPFVTGWVTAKVLGLLAYIGLGIFALRPGRSKGQRTVFWVMALGVAAYVITVAFTRDPRGLLNWF